MSVKINDHNILDHLKEQLNEPITAVNIHLISEGKIWENVKISQLSKDYLKVDFISSVGHYTLIPYNGIRYIEIEPKQNHIRLFI